MVEHPLVGRRARGLRPSEHELVQGLVAGRIDGLARKGIDHETIIHQPDLMHQVTQSRCEWIGTADNAHIFITEVLQRSLTVRMDRDADAESSQMNAS